MESNKSRIRVGKLSGKAQRRDGYITVIAISKNPKWKSLSPFYLVTDDGVLFENMWQFSKIYEKVPSVTQQDRWSKTMKWKYPSEVHISNGEITDGYWKWRELGFKNPVAIRRPVPKTHAHLCKGFLMQTGEDHYRKIGYIKARKRVYVPEYTKLVKREDKFKKLREMLEEGNNLLIVEYDGPHYESQDYYNNKYGEGAVKISSDNTIKVTEENLKILLDDKKHPFGHGYCIAAALLGIDLV